MPSTTTRRVQRLTRNNSRLYRSRRRNHQKLPEWMDADSNVLSWSDGSYKEQEEEEDDDEEEEEEDDDEFETDVVANRETCQTSSSHRRRRQCTAKRAINDNEQNDDSDDDDNEEGNSDNDNGNDSDSESDNQDSRWKTATKKGAKANAVTPETQIPVAASNPRRRQYNRTRPTKRRLVIDDDDDDDDDEDDIGGDTSNGNRSTINISQNSNEVIELLDDTDDEEQITQTNNHAENQQHRSKTRRRQITAKRRNNRRRPSARRPSARPPAARRPSARRPSASLESSYDSESTDYSSNHGASNKRSNNKHKSYKSDTDESDNCIYMKNSRTLRYIYCCPVCYVECYRRLDLNIKCYETVEDDNNPVDIHKEGCFDDLETSEFQYGPFEVMTCVDPSLQLASAFCFRKLKYLKQHLKQDHAIDASRDVIKNDIFHRFHMNQADGLVQRYLKKTSTMKGLGYMKSYFDHVQDELNDLNKGICFSRRWRRQLAKDASRCSTDEKRFGERAVTFWSSFSLRGHRIWKALQQAYYRDDNDDHSSSGEELEDDYDTEGIEEAINHDLLDRQEDDAAREHAEMLKFVKELKQKHNLTDSDSSSDDDELVNTDSEDEDEEPVAGLWAASSSVDESDPNSDDCNLDEEELDTLQVGNSMADNDGDSEQEEILFGPRGRKRKRKCGDAFVDDDDEA